MKIYVSKIFSLILASFIITPIVNSTEVSVLFSKDLPNISGFTGEMLTVKFAPGESSKAHRHNANTFVYVLEGTVQMQVRGGELATLKVGETFYESPADIHSVSRNVSTTESAKILVFFVKQTGQPSTLPVR